jgi:hypothetical protein
MHSNFLAKNLRQYLPNQHVRETKGSPGEVKEIRESRQTKGNQRVDVNHRKSKRRGKPKEIRELMQTIGNQRVK